jgi:hypothetical protein
MDIEIWISANFQMSQTIILVLSFLSNHFHM